MAISVSARSLLYRGCGRTGDGTSEWDLQEIPVGALIDTSEVNQGFLQSEEKRY